MADAANTADDASRAEAVACSTDLMELAFLAQMMYKLREDMNNLRFSNRSDLMDVRSTLEAVVARMDGVQALAEVVQTVNRHGTTIVQHDDQTHEDADEPTGGGRATDEAGDCRIAQRAGDLDGTGSS